MKNKTPKSFLSPQSPAPAPKGYWSQGRFIKPEEVAQEPQGAPSKTQLKALADEKQALGEALLSLRADLMARLDLPEKLREAIEQAKRISHFEGKRRQMQFIGKLMRPLDDAPIRQAIDEQANGSAALTLALHEAEDWRDRLIADDAALNAWLSAYPQTDVQSLAELRTLIRQARKDAQPEKPGLAPRHGKSYREIFRWVKQALPQSV